MSPTFKKSLQVADDSIHIQENSPSFRKLTSQKNSEISNSTANKYFSGVGYKEK